VAGWLSGRGNPKPRNRNPHVTREAGLHFAKVARVNRTAISALEDNK
jgi:hypothetical protein